MLESDELAAVNAVVIGAPVAVRVLPGAAPAEDALVTAGAVKLCEEKCGGERRKGGREENFFIYVKEDR